MLLMEMLPKLPDLKNNLFNKIKVIWIVKCQDFPIDQAVILYKYIHIISKIYMGYGKHNYTNILKFNL